MNDEGLEPKFPECLSCVNFKRKRICKSCDSGEFFEEEEPEGLDDMINGVFNDR